MANPSEIKTKTLYKALQVLDCFTVNKPELGVTEISQLLGLHKSNVHNIMDTFVKSGYMEKNSENGKYRLAFKVLELGHVISSNVSFRKILLPHMQRLADSTGETVYLGVPSEEEVIYLDSATPRNQLVVKSVLGIHAPLYCTGIGKAMLAFLSDDTVKAVMANGLAQYTDHTITEPSALLQDLEEIRLRGYAIDNMEHQFGIKCVGIPLLNRRKEVVAGLSLSGPSLRFDEQKIIDYARMLQDVAMSIEVD